MHAASFVVALANASLLLRLGRACSEPRTSVSCIWRRVALGAIFDCL